jgi:hypothetical protein
VLNPIPAQTVIANTLLTFTATATDSDQPPQLLTFTLGAGAPSGASITPAGVFSWTPTSTQAPSTNNLSIIVTDNGTPQLSATNAFSVVVSTTNSTTAPILQSATIVTGQFVDEKNAIIDTVLKTATIPLPPSARFYRLRSSTALRITGIRVQASELILTYE